MRAPTMQARSPAAAACFILGAAARSGRPGSRHRRAAIPLATTGAPNTTTRPSSTTRPAAKPCSHGLESPSGATAYMTAPSPMPVPAPAASVARATRGRRAVSARMAATYPATASRNRLWMSQV